MAHSVLFVNIERSILRIDVGRGAYVCPTRLDGRVSEPFRYGVQIPGGFIEVRPVSRAELVTADLLVRAGGLCVFLHQALHRPYSDALPFFRDEKGFRVDCRRLPSFHDVAEDGKSSLVADMQFLRLCPSFADDPYGLFVYGNVFEVEPDTLGDADPRREEERYDCVVPKLIHAVMGDLSST